MVGLAIGLAALWPLAAAAPARAASTGLVCAVSGSAVAFGDVDVLPGTPVTTGGTLTVNCVSLPIGAATLYVCVALSSRALKASTGGMLSYDLDGPGTSTPWSSTAPIAIPVASLTSAVTTSFTAVLAGSQATAAPGSYSQSLTATVYLGTTSCTTGTTLSVGLSFSASASVVKNCDVSASALGFGSVGTLAAAVDGQSALSVVCTRGTPYTVALDGGRSGAADPTARRMTSNAGDSIVYGLYQNAARSVPWSTAGTATLGATGTAATQTITVYGRVPVQTTPPPGNYSDTIVATVTY